MLIGFRCWEYKSLLHKLCFNLPPAPPISMLKLLGPGCTLVRENKSLFLRWPVSTRSQHWNLGVRGSLPEPIHFSWTGFYIPNTGIERCIDEQIKTRLQIPRVFSYKTTKHVSWLFIPSIDRPRGTTLWQGTLFNFKCFSNASISTAPSILPDNLLNENSPGAKKYQEALI